MTSWVSQLYFESLKAQRKVQKQGSKKPSSSLTFMLLPLFWQTVTPWSLCGLYSPFLFIIDENMWSVLFYILWSKSQCQNIIWLLSHLWRVNRRALFNTEAHWRTIKRRDLKVRVKRCLTFSSWFQLSDSRSGTHSTTELNTFIFFCLEFHSHCPIVILWMSRVDSWLHWNVCYNHR